MPETWKCFMSFGRSEHLCSVTKLLTPEIVFFGLWDGTWNTGNSFWSFLVCCLGWKKCKQKTSHYWYPEVVYINGGNFKCHNIRKTSIEGSTVKFSPNINFENSLKFPKTEKSILTIDRKLLTVLVRMIAFLATTILSHPWITISDNATVKLSEAKISINVRSKSVRHTFEGYFKAKRDREKN